MRKPLLYGLACGIVAIAGVAGAAHAAKFTTNAGTAQRINIPESGPADRYPSTVRVSGLRGRITRVTVTLNGLVHSYPDDIEMLLVSPGGERIVLMSDVGAGYRINPVTLTFDSASALDVSPRGQIRSGTYTPSNFIEGTYPFPGNGPDDPNDGLDDLNGPASRQNGVWKLYIADRLGGDAGALTQGWTLSINQYLFTSCADEGFAGGQLDLCRKICEVDQPEARLTGLIQAYMTRYRSAPPCAD
jgi:subtilisin-like proprotein convertase family protein